MTATQTTLTPTRAEVQAILDRRNSGIQSTASELAILEAWNTAAREKKAADKAAKKEAKNTPEARLADFEKKEKAAEEVEARLAAKFYNQPADQTEIVRVANLCKSAGKTRIQALANVLTVMGYKCSIWENKRIYINNREEADFKIYLQITAPTATDWLSPIDNGFNCVVINEFKPTAAKSLANNLNGTWCDDEFAKRGLTYSLFKNV